MGNDKNDPGPLPPKANNPAGVTAELPMKRISFISLSEFHLDSPEIFSIVFFNTLCIGSDADALTVAPYFGHFYQGQVEPKGLV